MTIILTEEESEEYFFNALCNGSGLGASSLFLNYDKDKYEEARQRLIDNKKNHCFEDVLMEILRGGGSITLVDEEEGQDPSTITLKEVHERVQTTPINHLLDMVNENDDGTTAEVILQIVFYKEIIFG